MDFLNYFSGIPQCGFRTSYLDKVFMVVLKKNCGGLKTFDEIKLWTASNNSKVPEIEL